MDDDDEEDDDFVDPLEWEWSGEAPQTQEREPDMVEWFILGVLAMIAAIPAAFAIGILAAILFGETP